MTYRPRRSALYMPGSNARALEKAKTLPADCLILDLEDAVAPDMKSAARGLVALAVGGGGYGMRELVIRVNAMNTAYFADDFAAAVRARPDAILIPKVERPEEVHRIARELTRSKAPDSLRIWAMMETPKAVLNAGAISAAARENPDCRLDLFVIGTNDLAKETRARPLPGRGPMLPWLATFVAAARAHGLEILDGVYNDIADAAGLRLECEQGRDFGMDGKTLIHPGQIEVCNEVFSPDADEIKWARTVIAAFDQPQNRNAGAIQIAGRMVERLHADMARRVADVADALATRAQGGGV